MKKFLVLFAVLTGALSANAQFEKGTTYADLTLEGFGIGYSHNNFAIGFGLGSGYYIKDSWMLGLRAGYQHIESSRGHIQGLFRYSFKSNGINLGCGLQYEHAGTYKVYDPTRNIEDEKGGDYFQICPQVGYTFYLNHYLSIEPALYADICLNDIKYGTNFGLRIGIGLYTKCKCGKSSASSTTTASTSVKSTKLTKAKKD